ncbi:hypothetical protein FGIG_09914 [Fasciola gigantica]|uniref:Uncharacterized protein n=1 Tax=Fasciola gigantica TaxID=46835 RepID=A0A504YWN0_FASGI|nr:hypothetical protein FGIG_09914 [Fasciola gigantica]
MQWIPFMLVYSVILLGIAIAIGQFIAMRREVSYSVNDLATVERAYETVELTSWTPLRELPDMPPPPPNLLNHIYLQRDLFSPEAFQKLKNTVMLYENFSNLSALWRYFWLSHDREKMLNSSELFIDFIQSYMELERINENVDFAEHLDRWYNLLANNQRPHLEAT